MSEEPKSHKENKKMQYNAKYCGGKRYGTCNFELELRMLCFTRIIKTIIYSTDIS